MPSTVFGLPTHALVVHAAVVLIPLAALAVVLHALWPAARARLGIVTPLLAGVALVLTPVAIESGEDLQRLVGRSALVRQHAELADGLLPWVTGLFVVAVALWLLGRARRRATGAASARWVPLAVAVVAVAVAAGVTQQVIRTGHAGAKAVWSDVVPTGGA